MTTYQEQFQKAVAGEVIPSFWLGYFREAFREEINEQLASLCDSEGVSRSNLARKIGRRPEQVTRWINSPSNIESDTISDLALAFGFRPTMKLERISFPQKVVSDLPQSSDVGSNVVSVDFQAGSSKATAAFANYSTASTSSVPVSVAAR